MRSKENLHPLLDAVGNTVAKAEEFNAFFALVFNNNYNCSVSTQPS